MDFDLQYLKNLNDHDLKAEIQRMPRGLLDEQLNLLNAQRSSLVQKLEAILTPGRELVFAALRPGGLQEIDQAIASAAPEALKERNLLSLYRDFNRILLVFMDAYEEQVFGDLKLMSKDELNALLANAKEENRRSAEILRNSKDYRKTQDASGIFHLSGQFRIAITKELRERFGAEPEN